MSSRTVYPNCFAHPVSKERGRPHFPRRSVFVEMHSFKEARRVRARVYKTSQPERIVRYTLRMVKA